MTPGDGGPLPFQLLGGWDGIDRLVEVFYGHVEADVVLRPVYPEDLEPGKLHLKLFLEQWLGGEPKYSQQVGPPRLRMRHFPFEITPEGTGRWLRNMRLAMQECGVDEALIRDIFTGLAPLAHHMINTPEEREAFAGAGGLAGMANRMPAAPVAPVPLPLDDSYESGQRPHIPRVQ